VTGWAGSWMGGTSALTARSLFIELDSGSAAAASFVN
jgi:hypothetical protein